MSIWKWVQEAGGREKVALEGKLEQFVEWEGSVVSDFPEALTSLLVMGADGVMGPFRPNGGRPEGKTKWQEVKVGLVAWLEEKETKKGKKVLRTLRRHVVAVLGGVEDLELRLARAALLEGILAAERVIWLSDGSPWLWGIFKRKFSRIAKGILDFYHVAQYLWKGAKAWLDGRSKEAREWFAQARHQLRAGNSACIQEELNKALEQDELSDDTRSCLEKLRDYLKTHIEHMAYASFQEDVLHLVSGLSERNS